MKLTTLKIKNAKPGRHPDGNGLYLQVSPAGTRSWFYRFQIQGKRKEMGLGSLEKTPATEARKIALENKMLVLKGIDPLEVKAQEKQVEVEQKIEKKIEEEKSAHTFSNAVDEYLKQFSSGWSNPKHEAQWSSTLETYAYPVIGKLPVSEITRDHILEILNPIWTTKTETATRVRSRIELVLSYAKGRNWRTGENPAVWRDNLKSLLVTPSKIKKVRHHPALPMKLMGEFMAELRKCDGVGAKALEFAILTAARSGEVRGAVWREIDLEKKMWIVPAERMKADNEHRVPLSKDAVTLLEALPRIEGNDLVFPASRSKKPISDMTISAVIKRMNEGEEGARWVDKNSEEVVPHGFRSTFRDWTAEDTDYPNEIAEMALAHTVGSKVEAAYRRGDMLDKRKQMMEDWAEYCRTTVSKKAKRSA